MTFTGKILLVDDEVHIRKFVSLILKQLGRPVIIEASNGEDALVIYQAEKPDFVLLDVNMPRMDGIETLRKLKELDSGCRVIMLTSLANRETVERALELGALNYIRKDTPKEEIAQSLAECIKPTSDTV
ncbi:response regulator transcription factor [Horticoccus sp. 23ND18S-11]|uniref:response regulator transcription factor n=1 Tax=Horticoccus sp. 23ND18S-11 TaxID=3391832 RepID=UPI0039C95BBB